MGRRRWLVDGTFAVVLAVLALPLSASVILGSSWRPALEITGVTALAAGHAAVAVRRIAPLVAYGMIGLVAVLLVTLPDVEPGGFSPVLVPSIVVFPVALYSVAAWSSRRTARLALAAAAAGYVLVVLRLWGADYLTLAQPGLAGPDRPVRSWPLFLGLALAGMVLLPWALGRYRRLRIAYGLELQARARREERARLAREMHDVVAHSLSVLVTQAEGGRMMARKDPAAALRVLETVARAGRQAMGDMRSLLQALDDRDAAEVAPQPGLADLPDLIGRVRQSGLEVRLTERGDRLGLSGAGELAAYRITQEALTNVLKHAGAEAGVEVRLDWRADRLDLTVRNGPGSRPAPTAGGRGLAGMSERVAVLGGTLTAGPEDDGGFRVAATLPA